MQVVPLRLGCEVAAGAQPAAAGAGRAGGGTQAGAPRGVDSRAAPCAGGEQPGGRAATNPLTGSLIKLTLN